MTEQNDSPSFQEAYEAALGAFTSEKPAFAQHFFENVMAKELIEVNELDADEETAQEALDTLQRNLNNHMYCARCNSEIVFHADLSFECACERMEGDDEEIPRFWSLTEEELNEKRDEEREYSENE